MTAPVDVVEKKLTAIHAEMVRGASDFPPFDRIDRAMAEVRSMVDELRRQRDQAASRMISDEWIWMPHPGHLIVAQDCRFHLNTYVGNYIVSTVGEWWPDAPLRELLAESRGIKLEGMGDERRYDAMRKLGYQEIGHGRLYETMVFKAKPSDEGCCPWRQAGGESLDFAGCNDATSARMGHLALCEEWASKR